LLSVLCFRKIHEEDNKKGNKKNSPQEKTIIQQERKRIETTVEAKQVIQLTLIA